MKNTQIKIINEDVELNNPILIEALPGVGHVGKLAADHIIDELGAVKFAELYSPYFPPQILIDEDGIINSMINEFYYIKSLGEDEQDVILLVGNTQGLSPEGQYEIMGLILDFVESYGVKKILTLGGIATGKPVENPKVFGAATNHENIEVLKELDIEIRSADGGIVGASGLLLSLGKLRGMGGSCLMGETPGYFIDAESAESLLEKLTKLLNFEINVDKLEERAEETRKLLSQAQQLEQDALNNALSQQEDDLRYIG